MGENENAQQAEGGGQAAPAEGGSGDKGGDKKITNVLSNVFLTLAAGWGITEIALNEGVVERPFATAAFGLFAIRGLTSAINYSRPDEDSYNKVEKHVRQLGDNFGFPLFAVDLMECLCVRSNMKYLYPLAPLGAYVGLKKEGFDGNLMDIAHAFTIGSLFVCGNIKDSYQIGIYLPATYMAYVLSKRFLENTEDVHTLFLTMGNVLMFRAMTDFL